VQLCEWFRRISAQPLLSWTVTARSGRRDILERN